MRVRVAPQPPLGWLETALKLAAIVVGVAALAHAGAGAPGGARLAQAVVLGMLALGLAAAIGDRLIERELVALAFVALTNLGHWAMLAAVWQGGVQGHLVAFAALMLAGELAKLASIGRGEITLRRVSRGTLVGLTGGYALGYAVLLALAPAAG